MGSKQKVLAVDDNETNLCIIEEAIEGRYQLVCVQSGEEALELAKSYRPDLILLDIMMPGIDGYETCRRLRADIELSRTKIIMVSAKAMLSERLKGYEVGADDYITKPFDDEELLAKVAVYTRLRSMEEIAQIRDGLLMLVGHEMNSPLNGILPVVDMLLDMPDMPVDDRQKFFQLIKNSANRLHGFVRKCLKLSALKSEQAEFSFENESLRNLLQEAVHTVDSLAAERHITIHMDLDTDWAIHVDHEQMHWALNAILENAIQHSPDKGDVTIWCSVQDECLYLAVTDRGEGFPEAFLPYLFNPFSSSDVIHHSQGHGLSMAIAQEIVKAHGGLLTAQNGQKQSGAVLQIKLPLSPCACESAS